MNSIQKLIAYYEQTLILLREEIRPGQVRARKGSLVEHLAESIVKIAWSELGNNINDLKRKPCYAVLPIKEDYFEKIDEATKNYLKANIVKCEYKFAIDVPVFINDDLAFAIECKAYSENAMLKRILFDAFAVKNCYPRAETFLFQLESQLGGDYSDTKKGIHFGSYPSHTLMSYFPAVRLHIITLLDGERHPTRPIHQAKYHKPLTESAVRRAVDYMKNFLTVHQH